MYRIEYVLIEIHNGNEKKYISKTFACPYKLVNFACLLNCTSDQKVRIYNDEYNIFDDFVYKIYGGNYPPLLNIENNWINVCQETSFKIREILDLYRKGLLPISFKIYNGNYFKAPTHRMIDYEIDDDKVTTPLTLEWEYPMIMGRRKMCYCVVSFDEYPNIVYCNSLPKDIRNINHVFVVEHTMEIHLDHEKKICVIDWCD